MTPTRDWWAVPTPTLRSGHSAFLSPLYQSLLSETEKKIAKKCLKEEVEKYEEADLGVVPEVSSAQEEEGDDFIVAGLFSSLRPRDVERRCRSSRLLTRRYLFKFRYYLD